MSEEKTPEELLNGTQDVTPVTPTSDMIFGIETIEDIFDILAQYPEFDEWEQFGNVTVKSEGNYLLFNYNAQATYQGDWNAFERMSRGLIIDKYNLEIRARPFDKFFNWGEHGWTSDARVDYAMQKMDGSLGVCWYDPEKETWRITTRGSFDSEQAKWATVYLHRQYGMFIDDNFSLDHTFLFEIIYPQNRVVVNYGGFQGLVLIGARINNTGDYYDDAMLEAFAGTILCPTPRILDFLSIDNILDALKHIQGVKTEGFVTVHGDGTRWKFKGEDYLRIHKVVSTFSLKNVVKALGEGTFRQWLTGIPDEFLGEIKAMAKAITARVDGIEADVDRAIAMLTVQLDYLHAEAKDRRKIFAQNVKAYYPELAPYLFRKLDGKLDREFILKKHDFSDLENKDDAKSES